MSMDRNWSFKLLLTLYCSLSSNLFLTDSSSIEPRNDHPQSGPQDGLFTAIIAWKVEVFPSSGPGDVTVVFTWTWVANITKECREIAFHISLEENVCDKHNRRLMGVTERPQNHIFRCWQLPACAGVIEIWTPLFVFSLLRTRLSLCNWL